MPCTRARSSHTRQRTSSYDEPSAARRPRRGRAHSSAPRGRRAPSLQSTLFIAAPQGHSGRNHSVWGTRAATRHRKRHPPSCVVDPPRASFRPAPLPTDLRPRILYRPPPRAGSYNLRSGSCTYLTPGWDSAGSRSGRAGVGLSQNFQADTNHFLETVSMHTLANFREIFQKFLHILHTKMLDRPATVPR